MEQQRNDDIIRRRGSAHFVFMHADPSDSGCEKGKENGKEAMLYTNLDAGIEPKRREPNNVGLWEVNQLGKGRCGLKDN
ncbi:hypothetical protein Ddc_06491 [Ditylenchus destructor]|nr:hypothetical protein Ddc_06491 [Ditylenchus destructor]